MSPQSSPLPPSRSPQAPASANWQRAWPRVLAFGHGTFYALSGAWPLLHLPTFLALTGPKRDAWLAQTVGGLLAITGVMLLVVAWRRRLTAEWALFAAGQAGFLATVDVVLVARDRIAAIYLLDALVEGALVLAWIIAASQARRT